MNQQRLPDWASATLFYAALTAVVAMVVYVFFSERDFPVDSWVGCLSFWPFPIILSAFFNSRPHQRRTGELRIYALFTVVAIGFTMPSPVGHRPDPMNLLGIPLGFLVVYPCVLLIEWSSQWAFSWGRQLVDSPAAPNRWWHPLLLGSVLLFLLTIVMVPPAVNRQLSEARRRRSIENAIESWPNEVEYFAPNPWRFIDGDDFQIMYLFDRETGLPLGFSRSNQITQWHNQQVKQLIRRNGRPANAVVGLPSEKQLRELLEEDSANWLTTFPMASPFGRIRLHTPPGEIQPRLLIGDEFKIKVDTDASELAVQWSPTFILVRQQADRLAVYTPAGRMVLTLETRPPSAEPTIEIIALNALPSDDGRSATETGRLLGKFSVKTCPNSELVNAWREQHNAIQIHIDKQQNLLMRYGANELKRKAVDLPEALRLFLAGDSADRKLLLTAEHVGWDSPVQKQLLSHIPQQKFKLFLVRNRSDQNSD